MRHSRLDALLLTLLVAARVRIDTLAEAAVLPLRQQDVARHPLLSRLLSPEAMALLAQQGFADPITLLLIVLALAALVGYLLLSFGFNPHSQRVHRAKLALIAWIILLTVITPTVKLTLLRQQSGPASYTHDGGVIQTEAATEYFLSGRNPYVEDYVQTPMAEWGLGEFRTALYHYPYLPLTFVFSAPFYRLGQAAWGWFDQRYVYLLLFIATLVLAGALSRQRGQRLLLVMTLGLNPIMGSDVIFGQNDSFVLFWIVLALWLLAQARRQPVERAATPWYLGSATAFGLACASKPTAWFLAPFYAMLLAAPSATVIANSEASRRRRMWWLSTLLKRSWPALASFLLLVLPYLLWNAPALIEDVWLWSSGRGEHAYQIWGWGASNLLLAFGGVSSRFDYWPFWAPQVLFCVPLLAFLLWRQRKDNAIEVACRFYALLLLAFLFLSRFLNENYLGYILAFVALGIFVEPPDVAAEPAQAVA